MSGRHRRGPAPRRGRHRRPPSRQRLIVPALAATVVLGGSGTALGFAVGDQNGTGGGVVTPVVSPFAAPAGLGNAPIIDPTPSITATPAVVSHQPAQPKRHPAHRAHPRPTDTLVLRVTGAASYVQIVTWNDHLLVRRILHHGQHLAYRQHGLRVVLGDAGAVRLSIAGHPAHRAGSPGEVLHFRVN
jgi:hypothetical protein